jgi:hypothetical protein
MQCIVLACTERRTHLPTNNKQERLLFWIDKLLPCTVGRIPPISRAIYKTENLERELSKLYFLAFRNKQHVDSYTSAL